MRLMGERGQAFSTFKLLIAAIVAVVILMILLSVLGFIDFSPRNQPDVSAADALEDAYNNKSKLVTTQKVTFTQANNTLARLSIVEAAGVGIEDEQVCLSLGDYADLDGQGGFTGGFDGDDDDDDRIRFEGGGTRDVKISVICYEGARLGETIEKIYDELWESVEPDFSECTCADDSEDISKLDCCLVALRIAR